MTHKPAQVDPTANHAARRPKAAPGLRETTKYPSATAKVTACGRAILKRPFTLLKRSFSDLKAPGRSLYTSPKKVPSKAREQAQRTGEAT